ncbi:hypothetical protein BDZ97DRAFT_1904048 [Flammula alnicola]|nr:hypothetical protein BDZ97DRAFT_1904048 [Flammula alnicola]
MARLNLDILHEITNEIAIFEARDRQATLSNLALICHAANESIRPILFAQVKWPHPDRHDQESGLHFFPEELWLYFRNFHLDWPDHWPDANPPLRGVKPSVNVYKAKHLDKLQVALPKMSNIHTFQMTCPFDPPNTLLGSLVACPNIKDLRITDTPLCSTALPSLPSNFILERMTLSPVAEVARIGEGPYGRRYHNVMYFACMHRKGHWDHSGDGNWHFAGQRYLFDLCRPECLRYLQISGNYCAFWDLAHSFWPSLETLVLTGPPCFNSRDGYSLADVVGRMPKLRDLRVLHCKVSGALIGDHAQPQIYMVQEPGSASRLGIDSMPPTIYSQITSLALSNVCNIKKVLRYTTALERLAVSAIITHPRKPIALSIQEIEGLLADLEAGGGNKHLKFVRIMSEDRLDSELFVDLGRVCPRLEIVEVEQCGYRNGDASDEWADYGDVFSTYKHLKELRIGIPFPGCDEHEYELEEDNCATCVLVDRKPCATYIASRVPTLRCIGFEYRARTTQSSLRYEDRWMDFDIVRLCDGSIKLIEQRPTWYPFPEVWERVILEE